MNAWKSMKQNEIAEPWRQSSRAFFAKENTRESQKRTLGSLSIIRLVEILPLRERFGGSAFLPNWVRKSLLRLPTNS
jgi:hypothetical protein